VWKSCGNVTEHLWVELVEHGYRPGATERLLWAERVGNNVDAEADVQMKTIHLQSEQVCRVSESKLHVLLSLKVQRITQRDVVACIQGH